jgi:hypothetical protein
MLKKCSWIFFSVKIQTSFLSDVPFLFPLDSPQQQELFAFIENVAKI